MFKPISRRTPLRGADGVFGLPWLEVMVKAAPVTGNSQRSQDYSCLPGVKGNRPDPENLPLVLAVAGKGSLRPGRRLRAPAKTPLCNLHLALLHRLGIMENSFGDSTLEGLS